MCLAVPGKIIALEENRAEVELSGNVLEADVSLVDEPALGDWVLVHAGFAIEKLDEEEARKTLDLFAEMGELAGDELRS